MNGSPKTREFPVSGDQTARVPPVPIPNTEVKPRRADDTARATVWERRSSPGFTLTKGRSEQSGRLFVFLGTSIAYHGDGDFCVETHDGKLFKFRAVVRTGNAPRVSG